MADAQGPGVRFPPPFVFVGGFLAGWVLDFVIGFEIDGERAGVTQIGLGVAAMAIGTAVMLWGLATFARARTPIIPDRPARQLVSNGPYRISRNPMYLGLTSLYTGLALVLNMAWPLVLLPFLLLILTASVIVHEERHLREAFGATYEDYCRRVRRWI
ncbi:MAG TPA: isoprenylcysteine carboxylmethyltransferase family protein [Vicinamibacterales bacterium]|nr:isoprenylcysteine carboxylmethyltransferase family protein [Vicinamibacterales bacterium]